MISREKDVNHKITIDKIDNLHLTRKALIILSIFNLKYWEKDKNNIEKLKQYYYNMDELTRNVSSFMKHLMATDM